MLRARKGVLIADSGRKEYVDRVCVAMTVLQSYLENTPMRECERVRNSVLIADSG